MDSKQEWTEEPWPKDCMKHGRKALEEMLQIVDECYEATGHIRVAKTSKQRQRIESLLSPSPEHPSDPHIETRRTILEMGSALETLYPDAPSVAAQIAAAFPSLEQEDTT